MCAAIALHAGCIPWQILVGWVWVSCRHMLRHMFTSFRWPPTYLEPKSVQKCVVILLFGVVSVASEHAGVTVCSFRTLHVFLVVIHSLVFCSIVASFEGCVLFNVLRFTFFPCVDSQHVFH